MFGVDVNWELAGRVWHAISILSVATLLGAALGLIRPARREVIPRSAHVVQAQILLAIVGAIIIIVVDQSLARAFAIVGVAGLIRYRTRIEDPKDAGVALVALALGLAAGTGLFMLATVACVFVLVVLWILESFEPSTHERFSLKIVGKGAGALRADIESALALPGVTYELRGSAGDAQLYEVTVPSHAQVRELTTAIRDLGAIHGTPVEWEIKKYEVVAP